MKIIALLFFILLIAPGSAQTETQQAGILPDSFLWNLEIALERITESATFNNENKIALQLKHADERIAEAQAVSDPTKALNQYNNIISRMNVDDIEYASSEMVRERTQNQIAAINKIQPQNINEIIKQQQMLAITAQHNQDQAQDKELLWWNSFTAQYHISQTETSILSTQNLEMKDIHKYVPLGITKITIKERNGDTVNEYTVRHTVTDITIKQGAPTTSDQEHIFEISDIKRYSEKYGSVINYGA